MTVYAVPVCSLCARSVCLLCHFAFCLSAMTERVVCHHVVTACVICVFYRMSLAACVLSLTVLYAITENSPLSSLSGYASLQGLCTPTKAQDDNKVVKQTQKKM